MVSELHLNAGACEEFIRLTKEEPSREWDLTSAAALCPDDQRRDQISGAHTGEWRRLSDSSHSYKCSIPGQQDGALCSHGGIIGSDHWSCCGELKEKAPCPGPLNGSTATTARFLVKAALRIKNPGKQEEEVDMQAAVAAAAAAAAGLMPEELKRMMGLMGGVVGGGGPPKSGDAKPKSKFQFK